MKQLKDIITREDKIEFLTSLKAVPCNEYTEDFLNYEGNALDYFFKYRVESLNLGEAIYHALRWIISEGKLDQSLLPTENLIEAMTEMKSNSILVWANFDLISMLNSETRLRITNYKSEK